LQTDPDLTVRVVRHNLSGESPVARLAGLIVGPAAAAQVMPGTAVESRLHADDPGSVLEAVASQLRGGAPGPVDRSVLDSLSAEQRQALAALVQDQPL
jgi:hypothetical protein